jgi:16S rRNA (guanine966-N2)-methyltransferase|tara:strand:- start:1083 stop:1640 length:558 start_codon:yes stop_codon:yes gene_type:complete
MRIISGSKKGKKILQPKDQTTRPLKDLAKESIFNILKHSNSLSVEIEKSDILDLFSGVGSFGLECLSRGAASVIFLENYKEAILILKKNISNLNFIKSSKILIEDVFNDKVLQKFDQKFDIIFIDPPYKEKKLNQLVEKIIRLKMLKKNGILIIHRHKKEKDIFPKEFKILKQNTYGVSKIIFGN